MATTPSTTTPITTSKKVKKVYKYFDLDTFEEKKDEVEVEFTPATSLSEANERINHDSAVLLKAINAFLQRSVFKSAKLEIAKKGARKSLVLNAIRVFRSMPPYDEIKDRKEQTKQLLEVLKENKRMVEAIRAQAIRDAESEEDDDDGAEDSDEG